MILPVAILVVASGALGMGVYTAGRLLWLTLRLSPRPPVRRPGQSRPPPRPDFLEQMVVQAGQPFGLTGGQWRSVIIVGSASLIMIGVWTGEQLTWMTYAAVWPGLIFVALKRWRRVHGARRWREAEDLLVGLDAYLSGGQLPLENVLEKLSVVCPSLAPDLQRCVQRWSTQGAMTALTSLAEEVPELDAAVAVLQTAVAVSPEEAAASLRHEASRLQQLREAAVEAQMAVQAELFKLTVIPVGITIIRVVFGAIWYYASVQFNANI